MDNLAILDNNAELAAVVNAIGYENATNFCNQLSDVFHIMGYERTLEIVLTAAKTEREYFIITNNNLEIICGILDVNKEIVLEVRKRDEKRKLTIAFCIYFTKLYYGLTYSQISNALNLNVCYMMMTNYHNIIKFAKLKNPKNNLDKLVSEYFYPIKKAISNNIK